MASGESNRWRPVKVTSEDWWKWWKWRVKTGENGDGETGDGDGW